MIREQAAAGASRLSASLGLLGVVCVAPHMVVVRLLDDGCSWLQLHVEEMEALDSMAIRVAADLGGKVQFALLPVPRVPSAWVDYHGVIVRYAEVETALGEPRRRFDVILRAAP